MTRVLATRLALIKAVAVLVLVLLGGCFVDRPITRLSRGGIEIRKVEAFEASSEAHLTVTAPGDYVLTSPGLRAVIGGLSRDLDAQGAVLELRADGVAASHSSVLFRQTVYVEGVEWRIRVARMYVLEREGTPRLRIEGIVRLADRTLEVAREVTPGRVRGTLSITTRVVSQHPAGEREVRLGARVAWGGPRPFIPGLGSLDDEVWHRGDWVGAESASASLCFGFVHGALTARASFEDRDGVKLLLHADVTQAQAFTLVPGVPYYEKSALVFEPSGLSASVRKLGMLRGRMFPEVWAYLPYRPEGSAVQMFDDQRRPLITGRPDADGRVVLPMVRAEDRAALRYNAVATAYGHAPSDEHTWTPEQRESFALQIPRGGQIRVRVRDSQAHEPIPFRLRLLALGKTLPPALGPDYRASGAGDTVVTIRGQAEVRVPAGRYRALLTRGLEWSLHEAEVNVTETFSPLIDTELEHQIEPGDWVACDLHVHAEPSPDSEVQLDDRLASLAAEGVGFAVATDHNHVTDYASVLARVPIDSLAVESGVEITTWDPHLGHFNAYPYPLDPTRPGNGAPEHTGVDLHQLFRALHALDPDLLVQINHPRNARGRSRAGAWSRRRSGQGGARRGAGTSAAG